MIKPGRFIRLQLDRSFFRFLAVGVLNTAFGYGVFVAIVQLPIPLWVALAISQILAIAFNFQTLGTLVFANRDRRLIGRFCLGYGTHYLVNLALLKALIAHGWATVPASALLIVPMALLSFLINRYGVFRLDPASSCLNKPWTGIDQRGCKR